jgi:Asp/Glu/hydantoin racemase
MSTKPTEFVPGKGASMNAAIHRDFTIGVLMIDSLSLKIPGSMASDATFPLPMRRRRVSGAGAREVLRGGYGTRDAFVAAARELEAAGVGLITTNCGFLVKFQRDIAAAVTVPVVASPLLLAPLLGRFLPAGRRLGILTYDSRDLADDVLGAAGIDRQSVAIAGVEDCPAWQILWEYDGEPDLPVMERELLDLGRSLQRANPDLGAILLECAAMPPFAGVLREALGLPIYDIRNAVDLALQGLPTPTGRQLPADATMLEPSYAAET